MDPRASLDRCGKSRPHRGSIPDNYKYIKLENACYDLAKEYTISFTGHKIKHYWVNHYQRSRNIPEIKDLYYTVAKAYVSDIHCRHESKFTHIHNQLLTLTKDEKHTEHNCKRHNWVLLELHFDDIHKLQWYVQIR